MGPADRQLAPLAALMARASREQPGVSVEPSAFEAYLRARIADDAGEAELERLAAGDLLLAHACLAGSVGAVTEFVNAHGPVIELAARQIDPRPEAVEDLRQALLAKLFVPERPGAIPKLADYSGRGPLRVWLKMAARRMALNAGREGARLEELTDSFAARFHLGRDVELSLIRGHHEADFRASLHAALASLTSEERLVLRLHYLEGLTSSELAPVLRTSRATAHRRLVSIRETLHERLQAELRQRMQADGTALEELLALLSSSVLDALVVELRHGLDRSRQA